MHSPAHPGLVLQDALGEMSVTEAAKRLNITRAMLSRILHGRLLFLLIWRSEFPSYWKIQMLIFGCVCK